MASLVTIKVRERGNTPRGMKRAFNNASKAAWYATAMEFHRNYRDKRFTLEHAREAGYAHRKGELLTRGSAAFRRSYTGRKLRLKQHMNPLEFSGDTRKAMRRGVGVTSTNKGGKAAYRGASKFNFHPPRSRVRMAEEFRRITQAEAVELAAYYDRQLDSELKALDRG